MSTLVPALAAVSSEAPLQPTSIERRPPGPHEVVIDIAYTGICHTDLSLLHEEWGGGMLFPMVPGHEISGHVGAVGADVTRYAVGDRVGVGCYVDSCRECASCRAGEEQHCRKGEVLTYGGVDYEGRQTFGGYSRQIVVDENYVLRIPETMTLQGAAPLLCAGITVYNPLRRWQAGPGTKVAVVGMGGLGHVAIKIAHAMGTEVTVLGRTLSKRDDGLRFGADDYRATSDPVTFDDLAGSFDLIINTVGGGGGLDAYLNLLRLEGVLVVAGVSANAFDFHGSLLGGERRIIASTKNGGIRQCQEMLDFCAEHGIEAETESVAADQVNSALERLARGDVRYRFVIDIATLAESS